MESNLVYGTYAASALGALAVLFALPRGERRRPGVGLVLGAAALGALIVVLLRLLGGQGHVAFFVLAALAVFAAVRVITHPRPVYSAVYFVGVVISTAGLAVTAGAEFLAAALVIVYAGAILVTYVFVIMLAQQSGGGSGDRFGAADDCDTRSREAGAAVLAGFVLVATLAGVIVGRHWPAPDESASVVAGNTAALGQLLLTTFSVSVELAGVLLMVAMIGAIALAKRRTGHAEFEEEGAPLGEAGRTVKPF